MPELISDEILEKFIESFSRGPHGGADVLRTFVVQFHWPQRGLNTRNYKETLADLEPQFEEAKRLSNILEKGEVWSSKDQEAAECLALRIFNWGGVTRNDPRLVLPVFKRAIGNEQKDAPMNSGWTKVAAFATHHFDNGSSRSAHVIWDSRVACSVVSRLDRIFAENYGANFDLRDTWLGLIPGRTTPNAVGLRANFEPRCRWRTVYGKWEGQEAGSKIVRRLVDKLNSDGHVGPNNGKWTVWALGAALFVDGK